ncbi:MAG: glycosyltransferase [Cyclobacteriaceae bacterium]
MITASVVLFESPRDHIVELVKSIQKSNIYIKAFFWDNSHTDELAELIPDDDQFKYIKSDRNLGFGAGHNKVMKQLIEGSDYHLVINPDIKFAPNTISLLKNFMDSNPDIGLALPKIFDLNGNEQPLFKLLPSPLDLIFRRFWPKKLKHLIEGRLNRYILSFANPNIVNDAPYLSGCFMMIRSKVFENVGYFDERFFLYCEDLDYSRRINQKWRTTYFPGAEVSHIYGGGSYIYTKLMFCHAISAIKYFNKYGWVDNERNRINRETVFNLGKYKFYEVANEKSN